MYSTRRSPAGKRSFSICAARSHPSLGIYANLMTRKNVVEISRWRARRDGRRSSAAPNPAPMLWNICRREQTSSVFGEGELTVEELLESFRAEHNGLVRKHLPASRTSMRGAVCTRLRNAHRSPISKPTLAGSAGHRHPPLREDLARCARQRSVNFITARGCPYKCRWCSHQVFGQTHRRRNPLLVVDEVEWLLNTTPPTWSGSPTMSSPSTTDGFASMRRRCARGICAFRSNAFRAPIASTPKMLDLLAELGCFRIWIGSESGSQRILDCHGSRRQGRTGAAGSCHEPRSEAFKAACS